MDGRHEPRAHLRVLVGCVVVEDPLAGRNGGFDGVEEADELTVPVALHAAADHGSLEDVEGGKQDRVGAFQRLMAEHGVTCSMNRSGNVWDNAAMESFFSSLKTERTARRTYRAAWPPPDLPARSSPASGWRWTGCPQSAGLHRDVRILTPRRARRAHADRTTTATTSTLLSKADRESDQIAPENPGRPRVVGSGSRVCRRLNVLGV